MSAFDYYRGTMTLQQHVTTAIILTTIFMLAGCSHESLKPRFVTDPSENRTEEIDRELSRTLELYNLAVHSVEAEQWAEADSLFSDVEEKIVVLSTEDPDSTSNRSYMIILGEVRKYRDDLEVYLESSMLFDEGAEYLEWEQLSHRDIKEADIIVDSHEEASRKFLDDMKHILDHSTRLKSALELFLGRERENMAKWLSRAGEYLPMMREKLIRSGLPEELAYLPLIESGYNPRAYSRAKAAGLWQFISSTGKIRGLRIDYWVDERMDPELSTDAAIKHLTYLFEMFHNWPLALAAYNAGEGRIQRSMKKAGTDDYLKLSLPRETRDYVPRLVAAIMIALDPEHYGFDPVIESDKSPDFVIVGKCVDVDVAAECAGTDSDTIKKLNPSLRRWCTHPSRETRLRLPNGSGNKFQVTLAGYPPEKLVTWTLHEVKKGETVSRIAAKYNTTKSAVASANSLNSVNKIIAGEKLVIPIPSVSGVSIKFPASLSTSRKSSSYTPDFHLVKKGESPYSIAGKYGVKLNSLLAWNSLNREQSIYPGQLLALKGSVGNGSMHGGNGASPNRTYRVRTGENLQLICRKLAVSMTDIIRWNSITDPDYLRNGQILRYYSPPSAREQGDTERYTVRKGDTISGIAGRFGLPVQRLMDLNELERESTIYPGNVLLLKELSAEKQTTANKVKGNGQGSGEPKHYIVKTGDNLWKIAKSLGTSVDKLVETNPRVKNGVIHPGQELNYPSSSESNTRVDVVHLVEKGESLYVISKRYGITVSDLRKRNNLPDSGIIHPGQKLTIEQ